MHLLAQGDWKRALPGDMPIAASAARRQAAGGRAFASNWMTRRSSSRIRAGADRADAGGAMRRSAAEGSRRQLDLPVRGYGGRHERRRGSHRSGARSALINRTADQTGPDARTHIAASSSITIRSSSNPTARNSVKRAAIRASASGAAGEPPAAVIGRAARAVGLIDAAGLVDAAASSGLIRATGGGRH